MILRLKQFGMMSLPLVYFGVAKPDKVLGYVFSLGIMKMKENDYYELF